MMRTKNFQVDAFASSPFKGNPAGVCFLEKSQPETWMKNVASEMNLSETAFLVPEDDGFRLRWFTPRVEVDLCGHATLASAHILWEKGILKSESQARFFTRSGQLNAIKDGEWIVLDFPALPPEAIPAPHDLQSIFQTNIVYIGKSRFDWLVEVEDEEYLRALQPDFTAINKLPARGLIVTSRSSEYDFISRFFAPAVGINEDPVTGSSHTVLTPYWARKLAKNELFAYQASERGGELKLWNRDTRVGIGGHAVTVMEIELMV
jgi:predicted PhzF superfamily epimerase YddE/YHI9